MIPKLHYISQASNAAQHIEQVQKACSAGVELVQLDIDAILENERLALAKEVIEITSHFQTRLIIKSHYKLAHEIKADGVYLESTDSTPSHVREQLYTWQTIGAAAHNLEECQDLLKKEVDYIGLGPFRTSNDSDSDSETNTLDKDTYTSIIESLETETPLLSFGKITTSDVKEILTTGISGLIISDAINEDFDRVKTFNQLLNASSTQEQRHSFK